MPKHASLSGEFWFGITARKAVGAGLDKAWLDIILPGGILSCIFGHPSEGVERPWRDRPEVGEMDGVGGWVIIRDPPCKGVPRRSALIDGLWGRCLPPGCSQPMTLTPFGCFLRIG